MFCKKSTLVTFLFSLALLFATASASYSQDAAEGESLFKNNCAACHNTSDEALVGPGLNVFLSDVLSNGSFLGSIILRL